MAKQGNHIGRGVLVGAVSGLVGSWLMLRFIEGPGPAMLDRLKTEQDRVEDAHEADQRSTMDQATPESVTMQAADVFASHAPGGRHLTFNERRYGGTVVHYTFGALMGAAYGAAAEVSKLPTIGLGTAFGTVLWMATDLWSVPAVGFAKPPQEEPAAAHFTHWVAHIVYGTGMESTRRLLRARI